MCADIMGPHGNSISWKHDNSFHVKVRDNAVSQMINQCGIAIITLTGDHSAEYDLSEYRKKRSVEKLFMSSKTFSEG